jgi:hypothetical protein
MEQQWDATKKELLRNLEPEVRKPNLTLPALPPSVPGNNFFNAIEIINTLLLGAPVRAPTTSSLTEVMAGYAKVIAKLNFKRSMNIRQHFAIASALEDYAKTIPSRDPRFLAFVELKY